MAAVGYAHSRWLCEKFKIQKRESFTRQSTPDMQKHYKEKETSCTRTFLSHSPGVNTRFVEGEALRLLGTNE